MKIPKLHMVAESKYYDSYADYIVVRSGMAMVTDGYKALYLNLKHFGDLSQLPECVIHKNEWKKIAGIDTAFLELVEVKNDHFIFRELGFRKKKRKRGGEDGESEDGSFYVFFSSIGSSIPNIEAALPKFELHKSGGVQAFTVNVDVIEPLISVFDKGVRVRCQICPIYFTDVNRDLRVRLDFSDGYNHIASGVVMFLDDKRVSEEVWFSELIEQPGEVKGGLDSGGGVSETGEGGLS